MTSTEDKPQWKASCKCGKVEFLLTVGPLLRPNCCCNDCVTGARWMDDKAQFSQTDNVSGVETGNSQSATMVMWTMSGIQLVKGKELIKYFKMRNKSSFMRSYSSCCNTWLICCGENLTTRPFGLPMNRSIIFPPVDAGFRGLCMEASKPSDLPQDHLSNSYIMPATHLGYLLYSAVACRKMPTDANILEVLNHPMDKDVEIVGSAAYEKYGFGVVN